MLHKSDQILIIYLKSSIQFNLKQIISFFVNTVGLLRFFMHWRYNQIHFTFSMGRPCVRTIRYFVICQKLLRSFPKQDVLNYSALQLFLNELGLYMYVFIAECKYLSKKGVKLANLAKMHGNIVNCITMSGWFFLEDYLLNQV